MGCGASLDGESTIYLKEWEDDKNRTDQKSSNALVTSSTRMIRSESGTSDMRIPQQKTLEEKRIIRSENESEKEVELLKDTWRNEQLYTDPMFPPSESSIYHTRKLFDGKITWMRPHEITEKPQLLIDGASRHDIVQGILADCWFLSSCAAVSQQHHLIQRIIPPDQPLYGHGYKGMVFFKFWRFGKWIAVYVDDLLPTKQGKLIFSRCTDPREFWVALLEKAYAKIHGSYESLEGGQAMDALVDLTGGLAERYELETAPPHLYNFLLQAANHGTFITCSRKGDWRLSHVADSNGLVSGHAYTISAVKKIQLISGESVCLLRIRNPWGNDVEWNGPWNDSDHMWDRVDSWTKEDLDWKPQNDGEFWMNFQDFCREFEEVTICTLGPDFNGDGITNEIQPVKSLTSRWELGKSCGGSRNNLVLFATNPQLLLTIFKPGHMKDNADKKCNVVIALMQVRRRCMRHPGRRMLQIGFVIYKVDSPCRQTLQNFIDNNEVGNSGPYINYREVYRRLELWPGYYAVVPATFEPNCPGSFMVRVYTDCQIGLRELE